MIVASPSIGIARLVDIGYVNPPDIKRATFTTANWMFWGASGAAQFGVLLSLT